MEVAASGPWDLLYRGGWCCRDRTPTLRWAVTRYARPTRLGGKVSQICDILVT
jgi:hypothetical protein